MHCGWGWGRAAVPAGQRAARSALPAQQQPAGSGLVVLLDTWAAAWGPPGTRTCPWGAQVSCLWGCHGPALSERGCETCGCRAHPAAGAAGETPALSSGSLWLLSCPSQDGHWCPLLLQGTCCVTRFGCVGNEAGHFGQRGERMTQGVGLFPCCWLFRSPLATPVLLPLLPRRTPSITRLAEPMGCCSPRGAIPVPACPNELMGLC